MKILDINGFATDFEKYYLNRGFGTMNKNDFEVLFFYLMQTYGDLGNKSNFALAKELEISEARVKRLAYEADLKYKKESDKELRGRFLSLLGKAKLQKDKVSIRFVVEDKYLRSSIYEDLKSDGYFLDYSFNSEIVTIQKEALIKLMEKYYSDEQKEEINKEYRRVKKIAKAGDKSFFSTAMSSLFDAVIHKGVDDADLGKLLELLSKGAAGIAEIVSMLPMLASI